MEHGWGGRYCGAKRDRDREGSGVCVKREVRLVAADWLERPGSPATASPPNHRPRPSGHHDGARFDRALKQQEATRLAIHIR